MKNVIIIGATSAIAEAAARLWAGKNARLALVGRDSSRLERIADDLRVRGAAMVATFVLDATDMDRQELTLGAAMKELGSLDIALIAHGVLPDQKLCESDTAAMVRQFEVNALSVMSLCTLFANEMERQGHGTLAVIGSVAGDRGRQSNYVYGSSKAAITTFLQGMRQRLAKRGVGVLAIKPGFVDTPMTRDFPKNALWATPDKVARDIVVAIERRRDVLYTPGFWRVVMLIIRAIPETVFKRLSL